MAIPALRIRRGFLLDIEILGQHIRVPPSDLDITPEIQLLPAITVFDPDWITDIVNGMMSTIAEGVFKAVEPYLDDLAEDFYRRRA